MFYFLPFFPVAILYMLLFMLALVGLVMTRQRIGLLFFFYSNICHVSLFSL